MSSSPSLDRFRVPPGSRVRLKQWPTRIEPLLKGGKAYARALAEHVERLGELQQRLHASHSHALLLIFQGMDTAGKDGVIRHVMSGINPQGCQVVSFSHPSTQELAHDFLWRGVCELPARGRIGVFNRSWYEEVLVVRVHPDILRCEDVPGGPGADGKVWRQRFRSIVELERHLDINGTRILKFFLHLSRKEQRKRLLERIDDPDKRWKFDPADMRERAAWKDYMRAYGECLEATSTRRAPWLVIPADDKDDARLLVSQAVLEALQSLRMRWPQPGPARQRELRQIRKQLARG
ncbi:MULTISPECIES: polyphosphate kinase 2 family protein [Ramlibacter]|uniref:Polyphosphate kinase 2 family protein n=1 Tax=Ramlibacter aquaticus TaxID=2780094 RepID=A0ABR9SHJ7_9BURK|nr:MULTISPECIES: polyphosphate kinase 2 family protein [Ramlibacter]MBE7941829.1 polyphosphate kinase 2 family protein [Ramlibacter aquaticus]